MTTKQTIIMVSLAFGLSMTLKAQDIPKPHALEFSAGTAMTIYQSVFSLRQSFAFEAAARKCIGRYWYAQAGGRLGITPALPEAFIRVLASPELDSWRPEIGIELGYTRRVKFDAGKMLLRETRLATESDISPFYAAVHAAPISYRLWDNLRVSFLEFQFGTHFGQFGRTLRAQIGLITVGGAL